MDNDHAEAECEECDVYKHPLEKIPRNVDVKRRFEEHYRELLGKDYEKFMNYSLSYIRKCIRVNTLKSTVNDIKKRLSEKRSK